MGKLKGDILSPGVPKDNPTHLAFGHESTVQYPSIAQPTIPTASSLITSFACPYQKNLICKTNTLRGNGVQRGNGWERKESKGKTRAQLPYWRW